MRVFQTKGFTKFARGEGVAFSSSASLDRERGNPAVFE